MLTVTSLPRHWNPKPEDLLQHGVVHPQRCFRGFGVTSSQAYLDLQAWPAFGRQANFGPSEPLKAPSRSCAAKATVIGTLDESECLVRQAEGLREACAPASKRALLYRFRGRTFRISESGFLCPFLMLRAGLVKDAHVTKNLLKPYELAKYPPTDLQCISCQSDASTHSHPL